MREGKTERDKLRGGPAKNGKQCSTVQVGGFIRADLQFLAAARCAKMVKPCAKFKCPPYMDTSPVTFLCTNLSKPLSYKWDCCSRPCHRLRRKRGDGWQSQLAQRAGREENEQANLCKTTRNKRGAPVDRKKHEPQTEAHVTSQLSLETTFLFVK